MRDRANVAPGNYTRPEAAKVLGISTRTLDKWIAAERLPVIRYGRSVRFNIEAIRDIAKNGLPSQR